MAENLVQKGVVNPCYAVRHVLQAVGFVYVQRIECASSKIFEVSFDIFLANW